MKLKSFVSALALAISLAGTPALAQTINILVEGGGEQLQQAIAEKFTAETGIAVNFTVVPYAGVYDKLSAEVASGTSNYDVATIDVIWMAKFAEFAESLDDLFTDELKADLPAALLADAQFGGRYIGSQDGRMPRYCSTARICSKTPRSRRRSRRGSATIWPCPGPGSSFAMPPSSSHRIPTATARRICTVPMLSA